MKKVISFVLTIFITISMFSCLGVASYAVNTVDAISFVTEKAPELYENIDGEYVTTDDGNTFFMYDLCDVISNGSVVVTYVDGTEKSFYYDYRTSTGYTYDDSGVFVRTESYMFGDEGFDEFIEFEVELSQAANNKFEIGTYSFTLMYMNAQTEVPVTITETPVESIEYSLGEPVVFNEYDLYEEYCEESGGSCIYGNYYGQEGDVLTVNYKDGTSVNYYKDNYTGTFCDENDNYISINAYSSTRDVVFTSSHDSHNWVSSNEYEITVSYLGKTTSIPVTVKENLVQSFTYTLKSPVEVEENAGGWWSTNWDSGEEYFEYSTWNGMIYGAVEKFTVTYKDGTTDDFVFDYDFYQYRNAGGEEFVYNLSCDQYNNPWTVGGDNVMQIVAYGRSIDINVSVVQGPESIEFIPAEPITYTEHNYGDWTTKGFVYGLFGDWYGAAGAVLKINYPDGSSEEYVSEEADADYSDVWSFKGSDKTITDEFNLSFKVDEAWTVGGDNYITVRYTRNMEDVLYWETTVPVTVTDDPAHEIEKGETVEATCSNDGYTSYTCNYCECTYKGDIVSAKGHNFVDGLCTICGNIEIYESLHPYESNTDETWIVNKPGASKINLTFSEDTMLEDDFDFIYIYDGEDNFIGNYSGTSLAGNTITVDGEVAKVTLRSDGSSEYYGFKITDVTAVYPGEITDGGEIYTGELYEVENNTECTFTATETGYYRFVSYGNGDPYINVSVGDNGYSSDDSNGSDFDLSVYLYEGDVATVSVNNFSEDSTTIFSVNYDGDGSEDDSDSGTTVNDDKFEAEIVTDISCVITSVLSDEDEITVPSQIEGYNVIGFDNWVRSDAKIVNLPETILSISEDTFSGWENLEEINISDDNTKYKSQNGIVYSYDGEEIICVPAAFKGTVVIPCGTTELTDELLTSLKNASEIQIAEGHTAFAVDEDIIYNADFTKIYFAKDLPENYVMKDSVKDIERYAFAGNETVKSVKISSNVTSITYGAFEGCSALESVELPQGLVSIEEVAFAENDSLKAVELPSTTENIERRSFYDCSSLTTFDFNEGLKALGAEALRKTAIESAELPDTLSQMGYSAFSECHSLSEVNLGKGIGYVSSSAFFNCTALKGIDFPANITEIESSAFENSGLETVNIPGTVKNIHSLAFGECDSLVSVNIGRGVEYIDFAFPRCDKLENLTFEEGFDGNCRFAFMDCVKLKNVDIPNTVTSLSYHQFDGCTELYNFDIPETLLKVDGHALDDTGWYNSQVDGDLYFKHILYGYKDADNNNKVPEGYALDVKNGTTSIAFYAFQDQYELAEVNLPYTMKYIGDYAFYDCRSLNSIEIPAAVTYIGFQSIGYKETEVYDEEWDYTYTELVADPDFVIYGVPGSVAETYAEENGFKFEAICAHENTIWVTDKAATCTEAGSKHSECSDCKEVLETAVIEKTEHTSSAWITDKTATCTEAGSKHTECTVCKAVLKTEEISAKGHSESEWIIDKKATVNSKGSKHKECTECKEILEEKNIKQLKCAKPTLKKVTNTASGVKITWNKVEGADSYTIYRKTGKGSWKAVKSGVKTTSYTDKTAKSGTTYKYTVKAKNEAGLSKSDTNGLSIKRLAAPKLKGVVSAKAGVTVKWSKVTGATGYIVMRKTGSGSWKQIATVKGNAKISYLDRTAKKGKTYKYTVKAYYGKTASAYNTKGLSIKDRY